MIKLTGTIEKVKNEDVALDFTYDQLDPFLLGKDDDGEPMPETGEDDAPTEAQEESAAVSVQDACNNLTATRVATLLNQVLKTNARNRAAAQATPNDSTGVKAILAITKGVKSKSKSVKDIVKAQTAAFEKQLAAAIAEAEAAEANKADATA